MIINKNQYGAWSISEMIAGHLVSRCYIGYNKKESIKMFKDEFYEKDAEAS